ncbi:GntR family transcriptional regulator [Candidatus Erwinia dacicola]|uniref:Bacterial regulatory, gntR family protein n=1 Tax=Candidatus Erwinia dacicola TaxID=252393 RepID=A0A1E7Z4M4_9GAMM|nr:GntR family transcriptional regulator [Candidatus Erwinia dacicola]NJC99197.1 GntR family transcriptional regulator [Candidatus Erwinia dacicola]OFC63737.1 GntR family transcriptional regulator [Candidatus Erwinia dacicola]RAP71780.1 bacterial regulatory, gntR family protein [Candidatus Erwinia dacicola]
MKSKTGLKTASDLGDSGEPIYHALMTAIVEHQLPSGSKLPEEALSEVFGVSRTGILKVLQRLTAVQMITLTPKRGAQVATPTVEEAQDIFCTRSLVECADLPAVLAHCQTPLEKLNRQEQKAHEDHDGAAAIRLSFAFHIQLQAISSNQVLTEMVTRLTQRSSLVVAAYGAPWQQGCRCDDHDRLVELLRDKSLTRLTDSLRQHFDHIIASLRFERSGETLPDFARLFAATGARS